MLTSLSIIRKWANWSCKPTHDKVNFRFGQSPLNQKCGWFNKRHISNSSFLTNCSFFWSRLIFIVAFVPVKLSLQSESWENVPFLFFSKKACLACVFTNRFSFWTSTALGTIYSSIVLIWGKFFPWDSILSLFWFFFELLLITAVLIVILALT